MIFTFLTLACMCGGADGVDPAGAPAGEVAVEVAPPAPVAATVGGWPASIWGVCQMESDCGCLEKGSVDACAASLQVNAVVFTPSVLSCIVSASCSTMCNGGSVRCVEAGAQAQMNAEATRHQTMMGIINNMPNGGPCANGQTVVNDSQGRFLRCQ